jgi:GT2 family glycosyltransferase
MKTPQLFASKRVAVVIVNWNGWPECTECLDSLFAQSYRNFHVFVVDNDSSDGSVEHITAWCEAPKRNPIWRRQPGVDSLSDQSTASPIGFRVVRRADHGLPKPAAGYQLTLVRSGGNLGFAGGCNVGVKAAGLANFDYFWFLNADTVVDRRALAELLERAIKDARVGMVGSTVRFYDRPDIVQAMGGARLNRANGMSWHIGQGAPLIEVPQDPTVVERDMDFVMGASMLVSARYIAEVGLMEEDYFLYFEEIDWALRGRGRFSLGFAPRSHVFHKWGVNSHKAMPLLSSQYYYRNRLRFVARFLPDRLPAAKRALFEQMLRHLARGRFGAARIILSTLMNARAITAGVSQRRTVPYLPGS